MWTYFFLSELPIPEEREVFIFINSDLCLVLQRTGDAKLYRNVQGVLYLTD